MSRGVESLFNKLRSQLEEPGAAGAGPGEGAAAKCDDCSRLSMCATRLDRLVAQLADEPVFRDVIAKMQCMQFQVTTSRRRPSSLRSQCKTLAAATLQTISEISFIWRPKRLVTLLNL